MSDKKTEKQMEKEVVDVLKERGPLEAWAIAEWVNAHVGQIYNVLNNLRLARAIKKNYPTDGSGIPLWSFNAEREQERARIDAENELMDAHHKGLKKLAKTQMLDPEKRTREELAKLILEAVDAEYRTLTGIKRYCGFPSGFDLQDVLESLIADFVLRRTDIGQMAAYFSDTRHCH